MGYQVVGIVTPLQSLETSFAHLCVGKQLPQLGHLPTEEARGCVILGLGVFILWFCTHQHDVWPPAARLSVSS